MLTAASAVAGAKKIDVVTATGKRLLGQVMGSDACSGVAVISTGGGLSPATFADEDVQPDDLDIVACLCDGRSRPRHPRATPPRRWGWWRRWEPASPSTAGPTS